MDAVQLKSCWNVNGAGKRLPADTRGNYTSAGGALSDWKDRVADRKRASKRVSQTIYC